MDQGWKGLPLLVNFLLLSNAYGFRDGAYSNAHHHWGQPSDKTFSPRAVQSSVSVVPVSRNLPEEVGSSLFANRPLKRLNLFQFVKGGVSSRPESTSHAQTAPSSSVLASLPLPLNEPHAGSLASLQGSSGSTITDTASVPTQGDSTSFPPVLGTSGLSTSNQSPPSLYMSSSQETKSAQATLPVFSQESISNSSSSAPGANYTSQGSPLPLSEDSAQSISPQGQHSYSSLSPSQGDTSPYSPDSYNKLSSSVSSQSTSDQSTASLYSSSSQGSSGSLFGASGSSFQVDLSPQSQEISNQLLPSPLEVSSQSTNSQSSPSLFMAGSKSSSDSPSTGPASPLDTQASPSHSSLSTQTLGSASTSQGSSGPELSGNSYSQPSSSSGAQFGASTGFASQEMSSTSSGSVQPQGTTSQFAPGSPSSYPSVSLSSPQGAASQSATVQSSRKQFTSTFTGSTGTPSRSSTPFNLQGSTSYGGSLQPQGTTSQFAPGSPSSYPSVSLSSPQGAASQSATVQSSRKQFTSTFTGSTGTQSRSSTPFNLQGSTSYGGSLQPQGTTSQFAPGSPSSYPSVSLSSPQGAASQSATVQSSRKQFTSSYGTQSGSSKPLTLQGSTSYGGSLQPQGTTSQFAPGSPSSYPSVSLSSPQGAASQSATVQSSRKQFTSSYGTQSGSSKPLTLQGSTSYGGSLQPQGSTSQFAPGSLSSYPSVSLSSPQGAASQSATVQSSRKQFTSTFTGSTGTQSRSSTPFNLQGSTSYGGSLQPQGTTSQFAPGSPSSYPSVSLSSPQGAASQSATVQSSRKQFTSTFTGSTGTQSRSSTPFNLQGSTSYGGSLQPQGTTSQFAPGSPSSYPSVSLSSPQGAASQSATVQSSRKQFTSSYGTQSGSSKPLTLQGSTSYGGSLQPQGTTSQFAPGSPSSYPSVSLSSPQGAASQSATVQSSRKQFTSNYGTQSGSSKPLTLQGSTSYGGSLQPQGSTSQFAPGSLSSYPSVSLSSPQGAASQSATVQSSRKQFTSTFTGSTGTQSRSSTPFNLQGSTSYGGSLQPQGTTSQFAPGSPSSYPSVSLSSPQGAASQSATVQSSRKQFTSTFTGSTGTQSRSSTPFNLQGSTSYGGSLQPQGTTSQFAPGSPSSYPSVSLSSPQGAASQSATVQSSRKQFTSSYGTQSGSSKPLTLQGSTSYGGSLQPQGSTSQFAPGSPSSYPSVSLSSPQGAASQSATVQSSRKPFSSNYGTLSGSSTVFSHGGSPQPQGTQSQFAPASASYNCHCVLSSPQDIARASANIQSSQKQFTSTFTGSTGTQSRSSTPFNLQGSTSYGGSLHPQGTTSQFAPGSSSSYPSVSLSSPQGFASQTSQAFQSYAVAKNQKSQRWLPSEGIQASDAAVLQGSSVSQSSPMQNRFSSSSLGGSSSGDPGEFASAQGGSTSYSDFSLHSQSPSSKYTPRSHAYAKLGSSPLAVSSQSTSDLSSNGRYSTESQGASSVSELLSSYGSTYNQNAPAYPSRAKRL